MYQSSQYVNHVLNRGKGRVHEVRGHRIQILLSNYDQYVVI